MSLEPRTLRCAGTSLGRQRDRERERAVEESTISTLSWKAVTWRPRN